MLDVINLEKNFGKLHVLKGINVTIEKGEVVCVIGPSGGGKSTFIRCLNLLEVPSGGDIIFEGVSLMNKKVNLDQHRQKIGMVFQHFNLFANKNVLDNVALALIKVKKMKKEEANAIAMSMLKRVGLEEKAPQFPEQLSGGQKQRVALARTMVMKPEILLLDEPLSALDGVIKESIKDRIRTIAREYHLTTIIVAHDPEEALTLSDRVLIINEGKFPSTESRKRSSGRRRILLSKNLS